jgi:hypothetical protein
MWLSGKCSVADVNLLLDDALKPPTSAEAAKRAYFLCRELESRCAGYVRQAISEYSPPQDQVHADECVKLMTWTCVYLAAVKCGGVEAPSWLLDFVARALRMADELTEDVDSKKFLKNLGGLTEQAMVSKAASRVGSRLGIKDEGFAKQTQGFIDQTGDDALELLTTALALPLDTVRDLVQLINLNEDVG